MLNHPALDEERLIAHFDATKNILFVAYRRAYSGEEATLTYDWLHDILNQLAFDEVVGGVFDFQAVTHFQDTEHVTYRRSRELHKAFNLKNLPIAFVYSNPHQQRVLGRVIQRLPYAENRSLVPTLEDGLRFIEDFHAGRGQQTPPDSLTLDTYNVSCAYDRERQLLSVTYYGILSQDVNIQVYQWLGRVMSQGANAPIRGGVFDFRRVSRFDHSNLTSIQRQSQSLNHAYDMGALPLAHLVRDFHQEQIVKLTLRLTPQERRKAVVYTMEEALQFIEGYSASNR